VGIDDEHWEQEQRGWRDPQKWVCQRCVGDEPYLKHLVRRNSVHEVCSYCNGNRRKAAPLSALMDALLRGIKYSYNDEANAGCPYDREFSIEYKSSQDVVAEVLDAQGLDWPNRLVADVSNALTNTGWVEAPNGDWMGVYHHERLYWSWNSFTQAVKHHSRFHFQTSKRSRRRSDDLISVHEMLPFLGKLVRQHRLVQKLPKATVLYRVRLGNHPYTEKELGAPSGEKSRAGRMNPAGISYLYLAFDQETARLEKSVPQGENVTVSSWSPEHDLHVIDLTRHVECPSVFSDQRAKYELVKFLHEFINEISLPVKHDEREHIEYAPTQIVSEYFAQVFRYGKGKRVEGLIYSSAVSQRGKNLVVFPQYAGDPSPCFSMSLLPQA
jgi:RES domain-containing protein